MVYSITVRDICFWLIYTWKYAFSCHAVCYIYRQMLLTVLHCSSAASACDMVVPIDTITSHALRTRHLPDRDTRRMCCILRSLPRSWLIAIIRGYLTTYRSTSALVTSPQQIFTCTTRKYVCYSSRCTSYQVCLPPISQVQWKQCDIIEIIGVTQEWHILWYNFTLYLLIDIHRLFYWYTLLDFN
jgi:hypothetical protein